MFYSKLLQRNTYVNIYSIQDVFGIYTATLALQLEI